MSVAVGGRGWPTSLCRDAQGQQVRTELRARRRPAPNSETCHCPSPQPAPSTHHKVVAAGGVGAIGGGDGKHAADAETLLRGQRQRLERDAGLLPYRQAGEGRDGGEGAIRAEDRDVLQQEIKMGRSGRCGARQVEGSLNWDEEVRKVGDALNRRSAAPASHAARGCDQASRAWLRFSSNCGASTPLCCCTHRLLLRWLLPALGPPLTPEPATKAGSLQASEGGRGGTGGEVGGWGHPGRRRSVQAHPPRPRPCAAVIAPSCGGARGRPAEQR